jgi:hypothetical protein
MNADVFMAWPMGLAVGAAVLLVAFLVLRVIGAMRWATLMRAHTSQINAANVAQRGQTAIPRRFDPSELDHLPAPVQRYFRTVLKEGQPIVTATTIEMTGTMNMSATGERWKLFTSRQRVTTRRAGFLWNASVNMFPGLTVRVEDSYIQGQGRLWARLLGLFKVAEVHGGGEIARGEFMRYFAEAAWYPTALLPSQGVSWTAVDASSAHATLADGPVSLTLLFRFNDAGLISSVHAESRGAGAGAEMVMLPWDCALSNYQRHNGMLLPCTGEAAWIRPEGRRAYFVGHLTRVNHEFTPT